MIEMLLKKYWTSLQKKMMAQKVGKRKILRTKYYCLAEL
ncbi:Uncharacterised protein [Streptococcus sp. NCTC 11567]|nr:Uncharacterised protein [Streptococcus pneumoniae]VUC99629.1 Uncharacterised protein [Streptococcus sp. NCTC 11567]